LYVYAESGGNDTVRDASGHARLALAGIPSTGVTLQQPGGGADLVIVINSTGNSLTISGYFSNASFQTLAFADGVTLTPDGTKQTLKAEAVNYLLAAATNGDTLQQQQAALALFGFTSFIDEGAAVGTVHGTGGDNVILTGTGDKTVQGGGGRDIYVYTSAGGNAVIDDGGSQSTLVMQDIAATGVTITRPNGGNDLVITDTATGKTVKV